MPRRPPPTGLAVRVRRGSLVGLALAMLALFAQIAAAMPLPPAAPGQTATVLGMAVPVCGLSHHSDPNPPGGDRQDHLLRCASCLCCHAPAMLPAAAPRAPLPAAVVYAAAIVLPPATAPPRRLAARPPPRAPPSLERRPD